AERATQGGFYGDRHTDAVGRRRDELPAVGFVGSERDAELIGHAGEFEVFSEGSLGLETDDLLGAEDELDFVGFRRAAAGDCDREAEQERGNPGSSVL